MNMLYPICVFIVCGALSTLGVSGSLYAEAKADVGDVMALLIGRIESLENRVGQYRDETENMKFQLGEMKTVNEKQQEKIAILESQQEHGHMTRQVQREIPVSFFATLWNHLSHAGVHQNLAFDHVVTNNGNAYNSHTGVFTAPMTGTYVFSASVTVDGANNAHVGFALNGNVLTTMTLSGYTNQYDGNSETIVLQLKQGDDVTVQNLDNDGKIYGHHHTLFSGFLLYV